MQHLVQQIIIWETAASVRANNNAGVEISGVLTKRRYESDLKTIYIRTDLGDRAQS